MDLEETSCKSIDWIDLVQVRDNWWAVVKAEIKTIFHKMQEIS